MKKTLFRQLITYMMLFCLVLCAICYAVIEFFFDDYYYAQQQEILRNRTHELAIQYDQNAIQVLEVMIDYYYSEYSMSVNLLDVNSKQMYGTFLHGMGRQGIYSVMTYDNVGKFFVSTSAQGMGMGQDTSWLSYLTQTKDGNLLLSRISYTSMDSVVLMVQQFFLYFGIGITVAFVIFAFLFSKSMSRPLRKLNNIASEMGKLNFSMRYEGKRYDEIGQLGNTLNALTTKLENTIAQLTGELSKERTLEKMRTQFTAQVSHELQTPLSVIKGYSEALADNVYTGQEANNTYGILLNEADKISNMVNDLLDLSQMEAGAYVIRKQKFSLNALLQKTYDHYSALPSEKQFSIHLDIDYPNNALYYGDPLRLEQAIRNILINAIKHVANNGTINIALSMQINTPHITIENEGELIATNDLPHIFDSYYQGITEKKGTGLGLAITRHIIKLHNGDIAARNTHNGVSFEIALP